MRLQSVSRSFKKLSLVTYGAIVALVLQGCSSIDNIIIPERAVKTGSPGPSIYSIQEPAKFTVNKLPDGWTPVSWSNLPGWSDDAVEEAWQAFTRGCPSLQRQPSWKKICDDGQGIALHPVVVRRFIEERFTPYQHDSMGSATGLMTGYYEPFFEGSRQKNARFRYPLFATPSDLVRVKPQAKTPGSRMRRDASGRLLPYWTREDIELGRARNSLMGKEIVYLENPIEVFVAQVQGSVRIHLNEGGEIRLGYADANGYPYKSIGKFMIEQGWLPANQASMSSIRTWLEKNPDKYVSVMAANPSYIFFRELSHLPADSGPLGSLGIPLTPMRSIAVDPNFVPLGSMVYLASKTPEKQALQRLVVAQDVGSAIQGVQRADFFWGSGEHAGELAGRSKQPLSLWVLWPRL
ncbi:MAG: MltA domain-containing protein [Pseudomonadota bacterium]